MLKRLAQAFVLIASCVSADAPLAQAACQSSTTLSCDIYEGCIEANCNCVGKDHDYSAAFGPKYCKRFKSNAALSAAGKEWRDKTLACLAHEAGLAYAAQPTSQCSCQQLEARMIRSHTQCYVSKPSFCALSDADLRVAARIVDAKDFFSLGVAGFTEVGRTLIACSKQTDAKRTIHLADVFLGETLKEGTEQARSYVSQVLDSTVNQAEKAGDKELATRLRELKKKLIPDPPLP